MTPGDQLNLVAKRLQFFVEGNEVIRQLQKKGDSVRLTEASSLKADELSVAGRLGPIATSSGQRTRTAKAFAYPEPHYTVSTG